MHASVQAGRPQVENPGIDLGVVHASVQAGRSQVENPGIDLGVVHASVQAGRPQVENPGLDLGVVHASVQAGRPQVENPGLDLGVVHASVQAGRPRVENPGIDLGASRMLSETGHLSQVVWQVGVCITLSLSRSRGKLTAKKSIQDGLLCQELNVQGASHKYLCLAVKELSEAVGSVRKSR